MKKHKYYPVLLLVFFLSPNGIHAQEKYIRMGDDAYSQYQYQTAITNYQKALPQLSGNITERDRITLRLAEIYSRTNDWKMASSYYKRLAGNGYGDKNPVYYRDYAIALQYLGEDSLAVLNYDLYLEAVPGDSSIVKKRSDLATLRKANLPVKYEVINEKSINSAKDDFSPVFSSRKEDEVIFTSNRKGAVGKDLDQWTSSYFSDLFKSTVAKDGKLSTPVLADEQEVVNTQANEGAPFIAENYSVLYFTRCEKKPETKDGYMWCVIMKAGRNGSRWTKPETVLSDPERNTGHPTLTTDELVMIYSGSNLGADNNKDLWMVSRDSKRKPFGTPVRMSSLINTGGNEMFPYLRNDSLLYFASDGHGGYGGLDIFRSFRDPSGNWSAPENLGAPVNSNSDDFGIVFKKEGDEGYLSSNRDGGRGGDDIYKFRRINFRIDLSGHITDASSSFPLSNVTVFLLNGTDSLAAFPDENGYYVFGQDKISEGIDYFVLAMKKGYFTQKQAFSTKNISDDLHLTMDFAMVPIPETPIVLPDILYELDKWDLMPQYQDSLRNLVSILKDNPGIRIELRSHTDSRATDKYNDELSQKRAQTVVDFLINEGIEPGRLVAKGYGKRNPRKMESDFVSGDLTIPAGTILDETYIASLKMNEWQELAHQLNRRTEFSVISTSFNK